MSCSTNCQLISCGFSPDVSYCISVLFSSVCMYVCLHVEVQVGGFCIPALRMVASRYALAVYLSVLSVWHTNAQAQIYSIHTHACMHAHTQARTHARKHALTCKCMCTHAHTCTHMHTHACTHIHTYTHAHRRIYACTEEKVNLGGYYNIIHVYTWCQHCPVYIL